MRTDPGTPQDRLDESADHAQPETAKRRDDRFSNAMLALLMVGTSWAIASNASIWLVPPYLLLMAWLLSPTDQRAQDQHGRDESLRAGDKAASAADDPSALDSNPDAARSSDAIDDPTAPATPSAPKGKRKGRARKVKPPAFEPTEATWVQVAPGKYVRVEASEPSAPAGPHGSPDGELVESVVPPPTLSETEDARAFEPQAEPLPESRLEPAIETESEPSPDLSDDEPDFKGEDEGLSGEIEVEGTLEPLGDAQGEESDHLRLDVPETCSPEGENLDALALPEWEAEPTEAVDGNAPQAEEEPEPTMEATHEAEEVDALCEWIEAEPTSADVDPDLGMNVPLSEVFEPAGSPAEAIDDANQVLNQAGDSEPEADPTETNVDETDLDDASFLEDEPALDEPLTAEVGPDSLSDVDESEGLLDTMEPSTERSPCWPWRLAPRARTRGVFANPSRTPERPAHLRRVGRSPAACRTEPTLRPRRSARRGSKRPGRATRAFPPRSPPARTQG